MLLRELGHDNIVKLDSVHINRAEPSLWLAFDYADHDLFEMIRFHSQCRENRRDNPTGKPCNSGQQQQQQPVSKQRHNSC